ncbi:MAG: hypothetical protein Q8S18_12150 [Bacteroidales bacterium]|nr:hypothetical protein [Bacteroidales bacterium]
MTRVYCTKKLKEFIDNVDETLPDDFNDIKMSDWNAHLFFVDKRKCMVFVNILTYYSVFIADIVKKDLKNIDEIFMMRLKEQLIQDGFMDFIDKAVCLTDGVKISFFKTNNNKKIIGRINDFVDMFKVHCFVKYEHLNEMDVVYENGIINRTLTGKYTDIKKTWSRPIENLREIIKTSA